VALLHAGARNRVLDRGDDDIPDARVATAGATENADAQDLPGPRVVGDPQSRLLLNHCPAFRSRLRQRLLATAGLAPLAPRARVWTSLSRSLLALTLPSPGSPPLANASWRTAVASPGEAPGRRFRTSSARRAPSACWCGA